MVELIATSQSGEVTQLDTQGADIELSLQIADIDNPNARRSPHSLSFRLPFTQRNSRFFEHYYDVNVELQTWSPHRITNVSILDDGIEVLQGALQLMEMSTTTGQYACTVVGTIGDLFESIRGRTWREVVGEELDHAVTAANIIASWDTANDISGAGAGVVVYPLIDMGTWYVDRSWLYFQGGGIGNPNTPIDPKSLRPAISVPWLLRKICAHAGYAISGDFLASDYLAHLYMPAGTGKEDMVGRPFYGFYLGQPSAVTIGTTPTALNFTDGSGSYYDPDGLLDSGIFTAPYNGTYQITMALQLTIVGTGSDTIFGYFQRNDGTSWNHTQTFTLGAAGFEFLYTANIPMSAGQTLQFYAKHLNPATTCTATTSSTIQMLTYDIFGVLAVCDVAGNLEDITVDKWLKAIVERFNLVLVPDDNDGILVVPWNDYLDAGSTSKDWSYKLDTASEITIRPTTNYLAKRIVYTDSEGKDLRNDWWQRNTGMVRGSWVLDNNLDFATEEKVVESPFTPLRLQRVYNAWNGADQTSVPDCLVVGQWQRRSGELFGIPNTQKPWLGYYHGTTAIGNSATFYIGDQGITDYPLFSEFNTAPVTEDSFGINWGPTWPDYPTHPVYNGGGTGWYAWRKFHARYFEQLYSPEARIMECQMVLTPQDVRTLKWNDQIWIRDAYWRVISISGYAVGQKRKCRVQLVKMLDKANYNCTIYPVGWNSDGTIAFESKPGVSATPNQECCESYGYTWDPITSTCRWKAADTEEVNPNPPIAPSDGNEWVSTPPDVVDPTVVPTFWTYQNSNQMQQQVPLSAFTNAGSTSTTTTPNGTAIQLKASVVYDLEVVMNAVQTGGTSGTIGNVSTGTYKMSITTSGGVVRQLGATSTLHTAGDFAMSVAIVLAPGYPPTLAINVTSPTGVEAQWSGAATFIATDVEFVNLPSPTSPELTYLLLETGDGITYETGTQIATQ